MELQELESRLKQYNFYHCIPLTPQISTPGWADAVPGQNVVLGVLRSLDLHGKRVLDIGCGPADLLSYLPEVDYVGIDLSPQYIQAARARYGNRATFLCENVADTVVREPASADVVTATGVLHHLNDVEARRLLEVARQALKPGGRFVALDGVWHPGQSPVARWVLRRDRGRFIRTADAYVALARDVFGSVASHVRHDMMRIPYSLHIMVCTADHCVPGEGP